MLIKLLSEKNMKEFKSWQSFLMFWLDVTKSNRYLFSKESKDFLDTVRFTSKNKTEKIPEGSILWRAQLGHSWEPLIQHDVHIDDIPSPFPPERMKPLENEATEGRANPKGISYLYLATHRETALSEVRPWIGSYISIANFKTIKELSIVNCTTDENKYRIYLAEPNTKKKETAVWVAIDKAFSMPVNQSDKTADYSPTQVIAETFKNNGYDGLAYRSSLGEGHNIVLFDISAAKLVNCSLFETEKVQFKFKQASEMYSLEQ